jgi:hypothetical protein
MDMRLHRNLSSDGQEVRLQLIYEPANPRPEEVGRAGLEPATQGAEASFMARTGRAADDLRRYYWTGATIALLLAPIAGRMSDKIGGSSS